MRLNPARGRLAVALLGGAALSAMAMPALAETAPAADTGSGLSDIVVTATRSASSIQKTPVSVTALGAEEVKRLQITNVKDLGQVAPNVKFTQVTGGSAGISPYIRGGSVTDGSLITSEPDVGIYIDDVYQPRTAASFIEAIDIERIEVLRGPQGTLYGRNSAAGALKIITREPGATFRLSTEAAVGTWGEFSLKGNASGPVTQDGKLRAGFSAMHRERDGGRQYNATLQKAVGAENFTGFEGQLVYVTEGFKAKAKGFYSHYSSDGQYAVAISPFYTGSNYLAAPPTSGSYRTVLSPSPSFTNSTQYGLNLNLEADLGPNTKLTSITSWSHLDDAWREEFSGGVPWAALGITAPGYMALFDRTSYMGDSSFTQELQLKGSVADGLLTYVAGLYYFNEKGTQDVYSTIFFGPSTTNYAITTDSYAAFGQVSLHPVAGLTVTAGGRWTEDKKTFNAMMGASPVNRRDTWRNFLPKVGVDYQLSRDVFLYASYSEGFKAGGYNGLATTLTALSTPYGPQNVKAYEIGFKSEFFDHKARLNVSAFINDYARLQQQTVDNLGNFLTQNYAGLHKGVEIEASVKPFPALTLWGNAAFNEAKYKRSAETSAAAGSYVGNQMTSVPKFQYTFGGDLVAPFGPGNFVAGLNYSIRADYYATPDNLWIGHVPRTDILNGYVGYDYGRWALRVSGKNLTDQTYWTTGFAFSVVAPRFMADPATWRVSLGYKF
ncbi:TonB-dependent receptor [Novosphingobium sp. FSY-8]|uniref:TonB-dependent receptor n=1 Tax=Novosphingobium ovatum TaxID=1908523 RepID=A0ABW9X8Z6_9SPHN|nr:TonB-dependent receptor [Novosphingobium ovatum]NBC35007.1 TonB-dependent receptor [Novosphingobium ovatum]